jgi:hypothetical protein
MLRDTAISIALGIGYGSDTGPERGELRPGSRLPAVTQLVSQRMTQLPLACHPGGVERQGIPHRDVLTQSSRRPPPGPDQTDGSARLAQQQVQRIGVAAACYSPCRSQPARAIGGNRRAVRHRRTSIGGPPRFGNSLEQGTGCFGLENSGIQAEEIVLPAVLSIDIRQGY